ncbi:MAG: M1 family aminopeptidase, partial [Myxococcota bacterium]
MLILTLLYTSTPALAGDRLDTVVRPVAQTIDLSIDPAKTTFDGTTTITFEVPRRAKVASVPLHGEGLTIREATLARVSGWRGERAFEVTVTPEAPDRLTVTPDSTLRAGTYAITFDYEGTLHEQGYGLYRFEHDGEPYVVSQMEADEARTAWPCFDEPSYKIPWTIAVEHPADTVAISNAPIVRTRPTGETRTDQFDTTPPMPSYALAVAVGPYVSTPIEGMKVPSKVWTTRGQERLAASAARDLPAIVAHLEDWFGEPYPYAKLDLIAAPKFAFGAMENPGAIVYTESLFFTEETATPSREHRLIEVSAHEVAHMWFGNLVTLAWWDDLWLNESFASFMGVHTLDALRPDARQDVGRVARLRGMLNMDGSATARPVRTEIDGSAVFETTNFAAYNKGEALLDMVEQWLGEETFQGGLRTYMARHRWGNATFDDLVKALGDISGDDLSGMLSGYLDRPGAPLVAMTTSGAKLTVSQSRYRRLGVDLPGQLWEIPLRLRVGRTDGTTEIVKVRLTGETETVELGDDVAWVHPAADGYGYYAWTLDDRGMTRLLDARAQLSPAERRSIWASLSLGLGSGDLDAADVLRATEAFVDEEDAAIRSAILSATNMTGTIRELDNDDLLD